MKYKFTMKGLSLALLSIFFLNQSIAQNGDQGWHLGGEGNGIAVEKAYDFLADRPSQPIIVAVIDGGIDPDHEDLIDVMWVNRNEIPGNGIDDDKNGYVDDIHGWSFIGGAKGDVGPDNLEVTRLYKKYTTMFSGKDLSKLNGKEKKMYEEYKLIKKKVEEEKANAESNLTQFEFQRTMIMQAADGLEAALKEEGLSFNQLDKLKSEDQYVAISKSILEQLAGFGLEINSVDEFRNEIESQLGSAIDYYSSQAKYHYNPDFDTRDLVGDNYDDPNQRNYGNNNVEGPDAHHGTHVAGIIAARYNNDKGIDGVARQNVQVMAIRAVPDGDERDKDVANAIRYAVDNGAKIINMSFGKSFSWDKSVVDAAVKYAQKKDVLLVHAAGNDGKDNDSTGNFPNDKYEKRGLFAPKFAKNFLEVGALNYDTGENLVAPFSNYGDTRVDVLAPGMAIYSTVPDNQYKNEQGTSMASPVVAGLAAIIRSYFPELSAAQIKTILIESSIPKNQKVNVPGEADKQLLLSEISVAGGIINAYTAIKLASETKGKFSKRSVPVVRP